MIKIVSAAAAVSVALAASAAWACGAPPPPPSPGRPGTAVAERGGFISVFSANTSGYSWDRISLPSEQRFHVANVPGVISGSVETDSRINTAIAGQNGQVVELSDGFATPLSPDAQGQTVIFGAALDSDLKWQVLTYQPDLHSVTLFAEGAPGSFQKVSQLDADCGSAQMLDLVVEDGGGMVGLCGSVLLELRNSALSVSSAPFTPLSVVRGSTGAAVAFAQGASGTGLQVFTHGAQGWTSGGIISSDVTPDVVLGVDDSSVVVKQATGFTAFTLSQGSWVASAPLDASTPVSSAGGAPAHVVSGPYQLTLHSTDGTAGGAWTATDLGAMGILPEDPSARTGNPAGFGCSATEGAASGALALLVAWLFARSARRRG